jgi:hypothetical protein
MDVVVLVTLYAPCARIASAITCLGTRGGGSQVCAGAAGGKATVSARSHDVLVP